MMKQLTLMKLWQQQRLRKIFAEDEAICLRVRVVYPAVASLGHASCVSLDIIDKASGNVAGEIALRIGEHRALFYLGHIGYHVDPPYRGQHFARRACELCCPFLYDVGMKTVVITTDEDNLPSIYTCERLGCQLESTVDVPDWCVEEFQISRRKRRYILWTDPEKRRL